MLNRKVIAIELGDDGIDNSKGEGDDGDDDDLLHGGGVHRVIKILFYCSVNLNVGVAVFLDDGFQLVQPSLVFGGIGGEVFSGELFRVNVDFHD